MDEKPLGARVPNEVRSARVLWTGALLGLVLLGVRIVALRGDLAGLSVGAGAELVLRGMWQDWLILLALTYATITVLRGEGTRAGRAAAALYGVLASLLMLWGIGNLVALDMLGAPVTMDWVAYSDIAHTDVIFDSIWHLVSPLAFFGVAALVAALVLGARGLAGWRAPGAALLLGLFGLGIVSGAALDTAPTGVARARLVNPAWAFLRSIGGSDGDAAVAALGPGDARSAFATVPGLPRPADPPKRIRNVLLYAYESTPARRAEGWEGTVPVTPHLKAELAHALAFDRGYAHVPASNYFLVSALAGLIPELSTTSMTETGVLAGFPSLAREMQKAGARTAFFNSSDNRFQNTGGFATEMGFEHVVDYRDWTCDQGVFEVQSVTDRFLNTSSDLCTADRINAWIDAAPEQPFFVTFRTGMTHHPYFPGPDLQPYSDDPDLNRYLNALRVGDSAFGRLMDHLRATGLADQTLVVVLGDHGEAFGEHGTYVHASGLFEENVHIPFAFINPQLFSGSRSDLIVGITDVAPTVADLLGLPRPWQWEGHSVFAPARPDGVMFFAPWNGFQLGFREGARKYIYNASTGEKRLFDLSADPLEAADRAGEDPEAAGAAQATLAAAVSVHDAHLAAVLSGKKPAAPAALPTEVVLTVSGTRFDAPPKGWVMLDGKDVGGFEVPAAADTTHAVASAAAISAAMTEVRLPLAAGACARRLDIWFLNDDWAGAGKTGDTDLVIRKVTVGATTYFANRFRLLTANAGKMDGEDFRLWRKGGVAIDLDLPAECVNAALSEK